jgi:hypothetical protein
MIQFLATYSPRLTINITPFFTFDTSRLLFASALQSHRGYHFCRPTFSCETLIQQVFIIIIQPKINGNTFQISDNAIGNVCDIGDNKERTARQGSGGVVMRGGVFISHLDWWMY